jgi:hypothetical protein
VLGDPAAVPVVVQLPLSLGGAALALERGLALFRSIRRGNSDARNAQARKELADQITGDVRDALTTQGYNLERALAGFVKELRDRDDGQRNRDDDLRRELLSAIHDGRRR